MLARIWKLPEDERRAADMSSLRVVFHMASACPIWLKEAWIDWIGPEPLFELYGGTERQGMTIITGREWLDRKGSVGKVQPGAAMRVLDAEGNRVPARPDRRDLLPPGRRAGRDLSLPRRRGEGGRRVGEHRRPRAHG